MTERPIDAEQAPDVTPPVTTSPVTPVATPPVPVPPTATSSVTPAATSPVTPATTSSAIPATTPPVAPSSSVDVPEVTAEDRIRAGISRSEEEQREDIAEVRADLGDTVEELVRRVDVPARVKAKRDETVANVRETALNAKAEVETRVPAVRPLLERPAIPAGIAGALLVVLIVVRRIRRRRAAE